MSAVVVPWGWCWTEDARDRWTSSSQRSASLAWLAGLGLAKTPHQMKGRCPAIEAFLSWWKKEYSAVFFLLFKLTSTSLSLTRLRFKLNGHRQIVNFQKSLLNCVIFPPLTWHDRQCSFPRSRWTAAFWSSQHAPCSYESSADVKPKHRRTPMSWSC